MTVPKEPVSMENALTKVLGELTHEGAVAATGRKIAYLIAQAHPGRREQLTARDIEALDLAHHARFGTGFPLYEALGRRLESAATERFADQAALARIVAEHAHEAGEATAASILATLPNADHRIIERALGEAEEADAKADALVASLRCLLQRARDGPSVPT